MKKFVTLSIAVMMSATMANADSLVQNGAIFKSGALMPAPSVELKSKASVARKDFKLVKAADGRYNAPQVSEVPSRAASAEKQWNVSYCYPEGSFFPAYNYYQTITRKSDNELLMEGEVSSQIGLLLPPLCENTWTNLIQKTTFATDAEGYLVDNVEYLTDTESCDWIYYNGDYSEGYIFNGSQLSGYDLTAFARPSFASVGIRSPYLVYGDKQFVLNDGKYITNMFVGGDAHLSEEDLAGMNESFETTLISDGTPVIVTVKDASNGRAALYDADNYTNLPLVSYMVAGNQANLLFNGISANEAFKRNWTTLLGTDKFTFNGFCEVIPAAAADYIAKSIEISALYYGPEFPPIKFVIYDITGGERKRLMENEMVPTEDLVATDEVDSNNQPLYGGQITLEGSLEDIFADEEGSFLNVPAGTELLVEFVGGENCAAFAPWMTQYDYTNGPDANTFRCLGGVTILDENGKPQDVLMEPFFTTTDKQGNKLGYHKYTSFMVSMDVEFPYLAAYQQQVQDSFEYDGTTVYTTSGESLGENGLNEVNVNVLNLKESEIKDGALTGNIYSMNAAIYDMVTNAKAKDVVLSYSSEDLENALVCAVSDGQTIRGTNGQGQTVTYAPGYVTLFMGVKTTAQIPTSGWVKASYKGKEVIFNFTETSGIDGIEAGIDGEAVASEYFDLQGRKVAGEAKGIMIKKMTMADGSVKAVKVVK